MRVLIVDDYEPVRRGLRILLTGMKGVEVCGEAEDGDEAIKKAHELTPDAVVMDISMPRLNGLDAAREIHRLLPTAQILILSQHDIPELMQEAHKAGASSYVTKSSIWNRLIPAIQRMQMGEKFHDESGDATGSAAVGEYEDHSREILESALHESEERFYQLFEQRAVGMAHVAEDGGWLRTNQKLSEILGYTKKEMRQLRFQDLTHPEDLSSELPQFRQLKEGHLDHYTLDTRLIRKDGQIVWVRTSVDAVRNAAGMLKYCLRTVVEEATQKDLEVRLARATRDLQTASGHVDLMTRRFAAPLTRCSRDMRYLWVNRNYADWLERPVEKIVGRLIIDVIGKEAYEALHHRFEQVLGGALVNYEAEANYQNIGVRKIAASYKPTFDASGAVDGWVALVQDITEGEKADTASAKPRS